jgi:hypothetical protein
MNNTRDKLAALVAVSGICLSVYDRNWFALGGWGIQFLWIMIAAQSAK